MQSHLGLPITVKCFKEQHNLLKMRPPTAELQRTPQNGLKQTEQTEEDLWHKVYPSKQEIPTQISSVDQRLASYGVNFETLKAMLRRENDLRISPETQKQYKDLGHEGYVPVTNALQEKVAKEFGLSIDKGVELLRCAETLVETDPQALNIVKELSLYRKYNRCIDGDVKVGMSAPNLPPLHLLAIQYPLFDVLNSWKDSFQVVGPRPLVLLAGSYS